MQEDLENQIQNETNLDRPLFTQSDELQTSLKKLPGEVSLRSREFSLPNNIPEINSFDYLIPRLRFVQYQQGILSMTFFFSLFFTLPAYYSLAIQEWYARPANIDAAIVLMIIGFVIPIVVIFVQQKLNKVASILVYVAQSCCIVYANAVLGAELTVSRYCIVIGGMFLMNACLFFYGLNREYDYRVVGGMVVVILANGLFFVLLFFVGGLDTEVAYCCLGILVYGIFMAADIGLILNHNFYRIKAENYFIGALVPYADALIVPLVIAIVLKMRKRS